MIIDSHLHISIITKGDSNFELVKQRLLKEMKINKVARAIVIPDNEPNPQCANLDAVIELTRNEPKLSVIATLKADQINGGNLKKIEKLFLKKQALGFKIFPGHDPVYPTDKRWRPVFKLCQNYDLPLIIHTGINSGNRSAAKYNDPKYIVKVAKNFKNLKIIIAHYFWPELDYCFKITAGFDNIYFDTSALADLEIIQESGGLKKIREILTKTVRRRSNSILFGTDWPIGSFKKHIDLINSLPLSSGEKQNIFFRNAEFAFRLKK
ncbi:MAG: hypothetical protein A3H67_02075 [Candidatus Buchananbacteria bacterium RIFCSPLOWO2_02_FULL_46_11b]|uniref:Amidohydrolase-related domain-containing protein n=2 Tax=Candidatus Buchananiibacteriota TaxID=1817903 RepID=A0A1G1YPL1_9BACT|nr:MAG: hypothetical protein A3B15_02460 [Candidatus Buchananbacteria bacterium RIFCSPLOWO2_01_FULL_45_31]OGY57208.1 MAG: hypothetical protein A3H67_02075 [Candidatus Buchananbacteria bacterium RIFCSPLOWO2_02_FULL_46_11b]